MERRSVREIRRTMAMTKTNIAAEKTWKNRRNLVRQDTPDLSHVTRFRFALHQHVTQTQRWRAQQNLRSSLQLSVSGALLKMHFHSDGGLFLMIRVIIWPCMQYSVPFSSLSSLKLQSSVFVCSWKHARQTRGWILPRLWVQVHKCWVMFSG